mgnify:CR=1 FL=1
MRILGRIVGVRSTEQSVGIKVGGFCPDIIKCRYIEGFEIMEIYKNRRMLTGAALLCTFALTLSVLPVHATDSIESLESQTSALENELAGINQDILDLSNQISDTEMQIEILNSSIDKTQDDLLDAEEKENKQYEDMKTRIKYMYENGNASLLEMLFSAKNMTDFLNKADFIENLSDYDRQALTQLQDIHQEIADQKEDLENQQASMQSLSEQLKSKQTELQAKAVATSTDLDTVNAKLKKAKEEEAARLAEEARQRAAAEAAAKKDNAGQVDGTGGGTITTGGTTVSADDLTLLAAIIQCEAHYNYESMLAVATVIMNRVESSRFPNSISGVVYANGQFAPVWTGSLKRVLSQGPGTLSRQVAQDAINGSRLAAVSDCYFFLYAPSTSRSGVVIGDNVFFTSW